MTVKRGYLVHVELESRHMHMNKEETNVLSVKYAQSGRIWYDEIIRFVDIHLLILSAQISSRRLHSVRWEMIIFSSLMHLHSSFGNSACGCVRASSSPRAINPAATRDTTVSWDSRITISTINVTRRAAASPDAALSNLLWELASSRMAAGIWSHPGQDAGLREL